MIREICLENVWESKRMVRSKGGYRHPSGIVRVSKDGLIVHIHCPAHVNPSAINKWSRCYIKLPSYQPREL